MYAIRSYYVAKLDLLLVVEMQIPIVFKNEVELGGNDTVKTHLENLGSILKIVEEEECKVCFFNLCFKEELLLIKKYMTTGRVFAEISLPYHIGNSSKYDIDEHTVFSGRITSYNVCYTKLLRVKLHYIMPLDMVPLN